MKTLCKYWPLFRSAPCPCTNSCWRLQLSTPPSGETAHSLEDSVASVDGEKEPLEKTREGRVTLLEREERTTQRGNLGCSLRSKRLFIVGRMRIMRENLNHKYREGEWWGSGRETLGAHLRVLSGCTVWGVAGEKSAMVSCARAWEALRCWIKEHGRREQQSLVWGLPNGRSSTVTCDIKLNGCDKMLHCFCLQ